ncbi:TlpA disulfide reductase family protein [Mucilaginibacter paludis]|uniref:Alkyl hydroperoxide reductase/ Thiol specific antioxidant/ Mal allergen n=1 Tax=Mucilaginibacter paludis DSM 18603 TaxID=714943 RepID=H1Y2L8_9SPHI|nr:TlpA disulfide reductase family protein [Mucilaginibacter paludis]EHQ28066.1 alkyl hydroperoxide reductase/ Thiol specific antioxidant/ Mal allergen [Mucilaginibacter paludis DSM 18603]
MKIRILLFTVLLPIAAAAQTSNFSLTGKIGKLDKPVMVYLDYMDNGVSHEDSSAVVNGTFSFSGTIKYISTARMAMAHQGEGKNTAIYKGDADAIYFDFGKEKITLSSNDSLSNAKFSGSIVYEDYQAYNKAIGGYFIDLIKAANAEFARGTPEQQKDTTYIKAQRDKYNQIWVVRSKKQFEFAKNNPHSYFGLEALSEASGHFNVAKLQPIYDALDEKLRATDVGVKLAQRLKSVSITSLGKTAPLFTMNNVSGKPVSLADLKGKVVLIDFWASWCEPCRAESPNLKTQYKLYKDKGFEIISVSVDTDKKRWLAAIEEDGLPWLQVSDLKGSNNAAARVYGVNGVPAFFLIDREGKIIGKDLRGEPLNKKLAEIFN